jgi:hypothetical protein
VICVVPWQHPLTLLRVFLLAAYVMSLALALMIWGLM